MRATWMMPAPLLREWTVVTGGLGAPRRLAGGEVVFRRDEPSESFFLIEEGLAKASAVASSGAERLVEIMGPGCLFGEGTALEGSPRLVTVEALSPLRLRQYRAGAVTAAMATDARIGLCLIRILAAKQRSLAHRLIEVSALPPRERLLDLLGRLPRDLGGARGRLSLTHEEIASYLGLSRITVTRTLTALRHAAGREPPNSDPRKQAAHGEPRKR
jgi:CRP/FNR family cyclic AMP-dependent transcriptional regulator